MRTTDFIAGMIFQNIASHINKIDASGLADTFTIEADIPKRMFKTSHWTYFSEDLSYTEGLRLTNGCVNRMMNRVCKRLNNEFKDYTISFDRVWYGKLFPNVYFVIKFEKKKAVKEVTLKELENILGYKIKIIGE